jgi:hypothetical protein
LADDIRFACEPSLPQSVAENDFGLYPAQIAIGRERTTDERRHAEHGEDIRRRAVRKNLDRLAAAGHGCAHVLPASHVAKGAALAAPLVEIARRHTCTGREPQHHEPIWIGKRQGAEQH